MLRFRVAAVALKCLKSLKFTTIYDLSKLGLRITIRVYDLNLRLPFEFKITISV